MQADLREDRQEAWISEEGLVCRNHHISENFCYLSPKTPFVIRDTHVI